MIAKLPLRKGLSILAVILLNFLSLNATAYDDHNDRSLSLVRNSCDSCRASESGNASGLSEAIGPSISEDTSSAAQNKMDPANASVGAAYSSSCYPLRPLTPQGPSEGEVNKILCFKTKAGNPNGGYIKYVFEWWENGKRSSDSTGYVPPDEWVTKSNAWHSCGNNNLVRVKAVDRKTGEESEWSSPKHVKIFSIPQVPDVRVPCCVCSSKSVQISAQTIDYCNNNVRYQYDYGDRRTVTTSLLKSGQRDWQWVSWNKVGTYFIKARAQNSQGVWSDWSAPIRVVVKYCRK
jgi:hypothetical protein